MMKTSTALGVVFGVIVLATVGLLFEAWLLGLILSWFGVSLSFWQNFAIIFLANLVFKSNVSSK
jgi:hypothetical protein